MEKKIKGKKNMKSYIIKRCIYIDVCAEACAILERSMYVPIYLYMCRHTRRTPTCTQRDINTDT